MGCVSFADLPAALRGGQQRGGGDTGKVHHFSEKVQEQPVQDLQRKCRWRWESTSHSLFIVDVNSLTLQPGNHSSHLCPSCLSPWRKLWTSWMTWTSSWVRVGRPWMKRRSMGRVKEDQHTPVLPQDPTSSFPLPLQTKASSLLPKDTW